MMDANELQQSIAMTQFQLKEAQRGLRIAQENVQFYEQNLRTLSTRLSELKSSVRSESPSDTRTLLNG